MLYSGIPAERRAASIEQICDYFAGCLLMPRPWLKWAWGNGIQSLQDVAEHFGVSETAAQVRLTQIGLISPVPRCYHTTGLRCPGGLGDWADRPA